MDKKKYISTVCASAQEYQKNLLNKEFLFVGVHNKTGQISFLEVGFETRHFMHLTGLTPISGINSVQFFDLCLKKRLRLDDIRTFPDGFSKLKADVLPSLMSLPWTAKMMGDYYHSGQVLGTEKVAGNVTGCMGFVTEPDTSYKVPNTVLKQDIRCIVTETRQILAVYQKPLGSDLYIGTPVSCAKQLRGKELKWPPEIVQKLKPAAQY